MKNSLTHPVFFILILSIIVQPFFTNSAFATNHVEEITGRLMAATPGEGVDFFAILKELFNLKNDDEQYANHWMRYSISVPDENGVHKHTYILKFSDKFKADYALKLSGQTVKVMGVIEEENDVRGVLYVESIWPKLDDKNHDMSCPLLAIQIFEQISDREHNETLFETRTHDYLNYCISENFIVPTPLKLLNFGLTADQIICNKNQTLLLKPLNDLPACVNDHSVEKLILRGWKTN